MTARGNGPCGDAGCADLACTVLCGCGRGTYPACTYSSCYDCYLDRLGAHTRCILCGRWHAPEFDTCFHCRPETRGRDDAAAALRQLIIWRDGLVCRYCGIAEGDLQADPRLARPACPPSCRAEHPHRRPCRSTCTRRHAHKKEGDLGVCAAGCKTVHEHWITADDGIRPAQMHIDHVIPCAKGGTADEWNLQVLCGVCNIAKGAEWWPGCRHDTARTELCRSYFAIARSYFPDNQREKFLKEVTAFRALKTWDPAAQASWWRMPKLPAAVPAPALAVSHVVTEDVPAEWAHMDMPAFSNREDRTL